MHWDKILTKDFLEEEIVKKHKQKTLLARELNCTIHTINKYLKKFNINISYTLSTEAISFIGQTINDIEILEFYGSDNFGKRKFKCLCKKCGNIFICNKSSIIRGLTKSCGCLKREKCRANGYKEISKQYFRRVEHQAYQRGILFNLNIKDVWDVFIEQNKKCAMTGIDISFISDYNKSNLQTASIDRIDSHKPYEKSNIQIVHKIVNLCKNHLTDEKFVSLCTLVYLHKNNGRITNEDCEKNLVNTEVQKI